MLVIGRLHTIEEKGYRQLRGELQTLELEMQFWLDSNSASSSEAAPAYTIYAKSRTGRAVQVGSAWKKTIKAQRRAGEEFLSLTFDDPSFAAPLHVAAFQTERPGEYEVTWRRRQERPAPAEAGDQS